MISQTNVPIMKKAVRVIYDMSEDTRIKEAARMREKTLHDEASALKNAENNGIEKGRVAERSEMFAEMESLGFSAEQIAMLKARINGKK